MAKLRPAETGSCGKVTCAYHTSRTLMMGVEWEANAGWHYDRNRFNPSSAHTKFIKKFWWPVWNYDGSGVEFKSPIGDMRYQKQWIKQITSFVQSEGDWGTAQKICSLSGIHVHVSNKSTLNTHNKRGAVRQKIERFLVKQEQWLKPLTHRQYNSGYSHVWCSVVADRRYETLEFRNFQSHPKLLLPAVEFAHSMVTLATAPRKKLTLDNWVKLIHSQSKYKNIADLYDKIVANNYHPIYTA